MDKRFEKPTELCTEMEGLYRGMGQHARQIQVQTGEEIISIVRELYVPYQGIPEDTPVRADDDTTGFIYNITHHKPADTPPVIHTFELIRGGIGLHGSVRRGWKHIEGWSRVFDMTPYEEGYAVDAALRTMQDGTPNTAPNAPHLPWSVVVGEEAKSFYDIVTSCAQRGHGLNPWEVGDELIITPDSADRTVEGRRLAFVTMAAEESDDRRLPGTHVYTVAAYNNEFAVASDSFYTPQRQLAALAVNFTQGDSARQVITDPKTREGLWANLAADLQPDSVMFTHRNR